jgi:hypothetical protein
MKDIGGYFGLELRKGEEFHKRAIRLNSGRNALEYILRSRGYKRVYLPYYTCEVLLEPINKLKLEYEFYFINELLEPLFNFNRVGIDETFIYTNYFGIKGQAAKKLSNICPNLIIDNSQAFFEEPIAGIDTFYSPRKFLGVPDGSYLFTDKYLKTKFLIDMSVNRMVHLLKRVDLTAESGSNDFQQNEMELSNQPIKKMSKLTHALLLNIDYKTIQNTRHNNFLFLHEQLIKWNKFPIDTTNISAPMIYPFLSETSNLRHILINNKIFVPKYWENVTNWVNKDAFENKLVNNLVSLPIDQRYTKTHMKKIIKIIQIYYGI